MITLWQRERRVEELAVHLQPAMVTTVQHGREHERDALGHRLNIGRRRERNGGRRNRLWT